MGKETVVFYQRFSLADGSNVREWLRVDPSKLKGDGLLYNPFDHVFHYGTTIFEGIRAKPNKELLKSGKLELTVINLQRNLARFLKSMDTVYFRKPEEMPARKDDDLPQEVLNVLQSHDPSHDLFVPACFNSDSIKNAIFGLLEKNIEENIITPQKGEIYIRPFMYRASTSDGKLGVYPLEHDLVFGILVREWSDYLPNGMTLAVHPRGLEVETRRTKTGANYLLGAGAKAQYSRVLTTQGYKKFSDVLFTDNDEKRNIEEATGANFFVFVKKDGKDVLVTPPLEQFILPGITRETTLALARNLGYTIEERNIPLGELESVSKNNGAAFLTGTATGLRSVQLVYDVKEKKPYFLKCNYGPFIELQKEYQHLIDGLSVSAANVQLQCEVRRDALPVKGIK